MKLTIAKKFIILAFCITVIMSGFKTYDYMNLKNQLINDFQTKIQNDIEFAVSSLQEALMASDYMSVFNTIRGIVNTTNIDYIKIEYQQLMFTKSALIYNSNYPKNLDWDVFEVSTDARNGHIVLESNNMFKLYSTSLFNPKRAINVRFVMGKDGSVINASSRLNFFYEFSKANFNFEKLSTQLIEVRDIYFIDEPLAKLYYLVDNEAYNTHLESLFLRHFTFLAVILLLINGMLFVIYKVFVLNLLLKPVGLFEKHLQNALENNFSNKIDYQSPNNEFENVVNLLNKILRKYTSVVNELTINKDILERKVFTDDLTGLPNQKVFELDLKNMFIVRAEGFVGFIKIESLGPFTKKFGSALANHLIEEFAHTIQNKFYEYGLQESTLYRFFGSEFAMIIKNIDEDMLGSFCENLVDELEDMARRYEIEDNLSRFSFIPFDKYGTIDSILHSLMDSYNKALQENKYFNVINPSDVLDKFAKLEQTVRAIIENQSFEVTFGFGTVMLETNELIMQEAIPLLKDEKGEKFPIGVFISAAEKIGLSSKFDKYVIDSVVNHIKTNEIKHHIAINISMYSIEDSEFINWLHSLLLFNNSIASRLVFSMTSYNVSTKLEVFKHFTSEVKRFGSKLIIKRYTKTDFDIDTLEQLNLDFLRIHKDYTNGIADDRDKKHLLRTLVNFGQDMNVIIIGDTIQSQNDLKVCKLVGLDAISQF